MAHFQTHRNGMATHTSVRTSLSAAQRTTNLPINSWIASPARRYSPAVPERSFSRPDGLSQTVVVMHPPGLRVAPDGLLGGIVIQPLILAGALTKPNRLPITAEN